MDLTKALSLIFKECGNFPDLPNHMQKTINKDDLEQFLIDKISHLKEIKFFVSTIYDEVRILLNDNYRTKKIARKLAQLISWRSITAC